MTMVGGFSIRFYNDGNNIDLYSLIDLSVSDGQEPGHLFRSGAKANTASGIYRVSGGFGN